MGNSKTLENWFVVNHFHQNFIFKKLKSKYKCLLYIPLIDENAVGFGASIALAKDDAINQACRILDEHSDKVSYNIKKEGEKLVLHVKV